MKIKLLDDLKSLLSAPHDTAVAREALSKALTGRVIDNPIPPLFDWPADAQPFANRRKPKQDKEKPDAK